jgi:hypothetical protein
MSDVEEPAIIARGKFHAMRELQGVLAKGGLTAEIVRPPDSNVNT